MQNQIVIDIQDQKIPGAYFRTPRIGPENDMIDTFISRFNSNSKTNYGISIFREPRVYSRFPDLVIVIWDKSVANMWNPERMNLSSSDLRVVHYIHQKKIASIDILEYTFGKNILKTIESLEEMKMVKISKKSVSSFPLSRQYATRCIIAVEAKISEWDKALDQAAQNRWFASESFILLPKIPKGNSVLSQAQFLDIGVLSMIDAPEAKLSEIYRKPKSAPISYGSWMFNEWVCQKLYLSEANDSFN